MSFSLLLSYGLLDIYLMRSSLCCLLIIAYISPFSFLSKFSVVPLPPYSNTMPGQIIKWVRLCQLLLLGERTVRRPDVTRKRGNRGKNRTDNKVNQYRVSVLPESTSFQK